MTETNPRQRSLGGKYLLREPLGGGGMGSVWVAEHLALHSLVAVKLIEPRVASNPETIARFIREARAAAALRSPHVVQILDHGIDEGTPYIVMELLEGESLAQRLERRGRLGPEETARVLTQVARAVSRAHESDIVHRDLKPANIFLVENDDDELAKVLDFGVAKAPPTSFETSGVGTQEGAFMGTPSYMSPEQAEGMPDVDGRSDLWSLGVIAFECLVGERPFVSEGLGGLVLKICSRPLPVPSQLAAVPAGFDAWFARACARNPDERFGDAKELASKLRTLCENPRLITSPVEGARAAVQAGAPPAKVEAPTHPFWEREPKPPAPPAPRSRRSTLPLLFVLGALIGVAVAFRRSVSPSESIAPTAPLATSMFQSESLPVAPVDPLPIVAAPPPEPIAAAPKNAPISSASTDRERPPSRRNPAPGRTPPKRVPATSPAPTPPAAAPSTEPSAPPPRPAPDRVNLGI